MTPRLCPIPPQLIPVDIFITESDNVTYIMIQVRRPHKCDNSDNVAYIMIQPGEMPPSVSLTLTHSRWMEAFYIFGRGEMHGHQF